MSFDVYVQRFRDRDAAPADAALLTELLQPYLEPRDGDPRRGNLRFADGDAEIYGTDDLTTGFMLTHIAGREAWDVLADIGGRAGLTIMPVGCPTLVFDKSAIAHLPDPLGDDVVVVATGADILRAIEGA